MQTVGLKQSGHLIPLREVAPGTTFEANGQYLMVTEFTKRTGQQYEILCVSVRDGKVMFFPEFATVVPLFIGFKPVEGLL